MWATIPSGDPTLVQLRARLSIVVPGEPFAHVGAEFLVLPRVVHVDCEVDWVDDVSTFVGCAKIPQHTSPYSCPFQGAHYSPDAARSYLDSRADVAEFIKKLSGRTLICTCSQTPHSCWAQILRDRFALLFGDDITGSYGSGTFDVAAPSSATLDVYEDSLSSIGVRTTSGCCPPSGAAWTDGRNSRSVSSSSGSIMDLEPVWRCPPASASRAGGCDSPVSRCPSVVDRTARPALQVFPGRWARATWGLFA